jgi:hypothetical protein
MIPHMRVEKDNGYTARLQNDTHRAGVRLDYDGVSKRWLVSAYESKPPIGGSSLVSGSPRINPRSGDHPPPDGSDSSVAGKPSADNAPGTGTERKPSGPTHLGAGLGAFEPFLRESIDDIKAASALRTILGPSY